MVYLVFWYACDSGYKTDSVWSTQERAEARRRECIEADLDEGWYNKAELEVEWEVIPCAPLDLD